MNERLTRDEVVRTARVLLDGGGLPALGMRRIASELGVQQSALYWHFENKQALLAALADDIVAEVAPTPDGPWPQRLVALCLRVRDVLLAHRDGAELVSTAIAFRLGGGTIASLLDAELAEAGASAAQQRTAATVLLHYLLGAIGDEQQHRQAAALGAIERRTNDTDPSVDVFVRGVELIVAGLEAQLGRDPDRASPHVPVHRRASATSSD
jgi:AcrR family transcriptional regulator